MGIYKIISISCGTAAAGIMVATGMLLYKNKKKKKEDDLNTTLKLLAITDDIQNMAIDNCNKCIKKLNEKIDSFEKSIKK